MDDRKKLCDLAKLVVEVGPAVLAASFKPFPMICINAGGQELALKFGAAYTVTGENGDCWYIDEFAQGGDFAKRRFIAPEQWPAWLDARAAYHLEQAMKYLDLRREVAPYGRF